MERPVLFRVGVLATLAVGGLLLASYVQHHSRLSPQERANAILLTDYQRKVPLGTARARVLAYLDEHATAYRHLCCIDQRAFTAVEVQREDVWLSREANVYVAFVFESAAGASIGQDTFDNERLTKILLYRDAD